MYIAIDFGGTKPLVGLLDHDGEVKKAVKFPTSENYQDFLQELKTSVVELINGQEITAACMAIPGTVDRQNGIILHLGNLNWPKEIPIKADISTFLNCPVVIENDANTAALSEALIVKDMYQKALYITISTGIGSGYVVDGKLDEALLDVEIGHNMYEHEGKVQEWEDFASGSWIVKTYGKKASELEDESAWRKISENIAIGIVNAVNSLDPDVIIIGGGVGTHLPKFKDYLDDAISKIDPGFNKIPPIIQAQRPEEAVIYGCYELAKQSV